MLNSKGLIGRGFRPEDFGDDVGTLNFTDWPAEIRRYAQHFRAETEPVAFDARETRIGNRENYLHIQVTARNAADESQRKQ